MITLLLCLCGSGYRVFLYILYLSCLQVLSVSALAMNSMSLPFLLFLHVLPLASKEMLFVETHNDTMLHAVAPKTKPNETDQRSVGSSKEVGQDYSSRGGDEWLNPALMEASEDSWALGHAPARGGGGPSSDHQVGGGSLRNFKDTKDQLIGRPPPLTKAVSWMVKEKKISEERDDEYVEESEEERKKEEREEERGKLLLIPGQAPRTSRRASVDRGSMGIRSRQGRRGKWNMPVWIPGVNYTEAEAMNQMIADKCKRCKRACKLSDNWRQYCRWVAMLSNCIESESELYFTNSDADALSLYSC